MLNTVEDTSANTNNAVSMTIRARLFRAIEPTARNEPGLSALNWALVLLIVSATVLAILQTEPLVVEGRETFFAVIELSFATIFAVEYFVRFWVAAEHPGGSNWCKRMRFVFSLAGLLDLAIILVTIAPFVTMNLMVLRLVRLLRILRLAKLGRMSDAMRRISAAVLARKFELLFTMGLAGAVLIFGATALHFLEGELQPDKFGSIPRAMWWSVVTLTTIGYGDVYPITVSGKIVASIVAVAGVGLIAMPTGILAAAFTDAVQGNQV